MLTIFSAPRAFHRQFDTIQRNAILSWKKLSPECEIILFGNEEGIAEVAAELGVKHIPEVKCNEFGTPLISDLFERAQRIASHSKLIYINADIILMSDFLKGIESVDLSEFLIVGRRWDLDVKERIQFDEENWEDKLRKRISEDGKLHGFSGIDYFIFPRNLWKKIPPFALARTAWDNWLLYQARLSKVPLIDATGIITAVHQNHDYSHHIEGRAGVWKGQEAKINLRLAGGYSHLFTIRDANWILTEGGLERPSFPRRIFPALSMFYPWRSTLSIKRKLQNL